MKTLFCTALLAATLVLPTAVFAQPSTQGNEIQVETIAYESVSPDTTSAQIHTPAVKDRVGAQERILSDEQFNPAADVGLNSIYTRH